MAFARVTVVGGVVVVGILAGCLDAGTPPKGRHVVAGRDEDSVELVAGATGAASRIVLSHAQTESGTNFVPTTRLSTIDDPGPDGGAMTPRVLLDRTVGSLPTTMSPSFCMPAGCNLPVDARGRLYLARLSLQADQYGSSEELVRVDPSSGEQHSFGNVDAFDISSSGTRIMVETMFGAAAVVDLDDSSTSLSAGGQPPLFVGDDLFFVASDGTFMHLPPATNAPIPLIAAVSGFESFATERGGLIVLRRAMPGGVPGASSLFDPTALLETDLPSVTASGQTYLPSPDGRYLASEGFGSTNLAIAAHLTIFDRDTARETVHELPSQQSVQSPVWRPDHDEVWFIAKDQAWRWQPDQEAIPVNSGALSPFFSSGFVVTSPQEVSVTAGSSPVFTPDGRFRLVAAGDFGKPSVYLQSADDDTAPPLRLNPDGTGLAGLWPLVDGRLLVEAWINDGRRNDIYLVDPGAGVTRSIASTGHVLATGRDRFLALQHVVLADGSGDLTSIDYATGTETLIAENVHSVAVDSSTVLDDALAPGTRVVYLVRNRIASPYDGCWTIDLP